MRQYNVTGMSCAACSARVEKAVGKVPGVTSCSVSLLTNSMGVEGTAEPSAILAAVEAAGYGASEKGAAQSSPSAGEQQLEDRETPRIRRRLIWSVGFLLVLMYFSMGHMMWGWPLPPFYDNNHVAMGLTQLLLTVIILCLATLSVLSFSTARADLALAQKQARQAQSVYALECAGQQWLAELDAALAQAGDTAELDALLPHGTAREGPGVSAVLEGADGRSLSVFAELTADGGYRVIQWQQSAEWAGEAEAPALFGTLREG